MKNYLTLIRYKNLLFLAFSQMAINYIFLKNAINNLPLNNLHFILLVITTLCLAAAGYIINNIEDVEADNINKPKNVVIGKHISENTAFKLYLILNIVGVILGIYLANFIEKSNFAVSFVLIALLLYWYATSLKKIPILGNIIVSLLVGYSIIIVGFFQLYPIITSKNSEYISNLFSIILDFAAFATLINFIREIIKDLEDVKGDKNVGIKTLPIILGINKTAKLISLLSIIAIVILILYVKNNLIDYIYVSLYFLLFIIAPLLYFTIKVFSAKETTEFHKLSTILKIIMFTGIISLIVISYSIRYVK